MLSSVVISGRHVTKSVQSDVVRRDFRAAVARHLRLQKVDMLLGPGADVKVRMGVKRGDLLAGGA